MRNMVGPRFAVFGGVTLGLCVAAACASFDDAADPVGTNDGGAEGGADGGAFVCDATFCSSFDDEPFDKGWQTRGSGSVPASIGPTESSPLSAPRAFRSVHEPGEGAGDTQLMYFRPGALKHVHVAFSLRVVESPTGSGYQIATVGWGKDASKFDAVTELQISVDEGKIRVVRDEDEVGDAEGIHERGGDFSFALGKWQVVDVDVTFGADNAVDAKVTFAGDAIFTSSFKSTGGSTDAEIGIGIPGSYGTVTSRGITDIDNVSVSIE
jgi:hypothetical protein